MEDTNAYFNVSKQTTYKNRKYYLPFYVYHVILIKLGKPFDYGMYIIES